MRRRERHRDLVNATLENRALVMREDRALPERPSYLVTRYDPVVYLSRATATNGHLGAIDLT